MHTISVEIYSEKNGTIGITQLDVHIKSKNFTDYLPRFIRRRADENIREKRGLGLATGMILGGSAIANIFSSSYSSS